MLWKLRKKIWENQALVDNITSEAALKRIPIMMFVPVLECARVSMGKVVPHVYTKQLLCYIMVSKLVTA